jgi:uncharacterized phage protein gp47/JayE
VNRVTTDLETSLEVVNASLRKNFVKLFGKVFGGIVHLLYGYLDWIFDQAFPDTAEDENLARLASIWNIQKKAATFAELTVTFTGTNGVSIPEDTELTSSDGIIFQTLSTVVIAGGTASVSVRSQTAGVVGNSDPGAVLTLVSQISGVTSEVTVASEDITAIDEETNTELRDRLLARLQNPPLGGAAADYEIWAKEVSGVTRAWAEPLYLGDGTVGIFFVRDNDTDSIYPTSSEIETVSDYIELKKPVTAKHYVFSPTAYPVDFTINVTPDTEDVRAAVEEELSDVFEREGAPGALIYLSHLDEAISLAAGETNHNLVSPVADVDPCDGFLPTLGTVSYI